MATATDFHACDHDVVMKVPLDSRWVVIEITCGQGGKWYWVEDQDWSND